jgi:hypothetical protein
VSEVVSDATCKNNETKLNPDIEFISVDVREHPSAKSKESPEDSQVAGGAAV